MIVAVFVTSASYKNSIALLSRFVENLLLYAFPGKLLTTLRATDPDGDTIRFSIDIDDYFDITVIDANSVEVRSIRGIDYERNAQVQFTITATDEVSNSKVSQSHFLALGL